MTVSEKECETLKLILDRIKSSVNVEHKYIDFTRKNGWNYSDVLYSFKGVYTLGIKVFYPELVELRGRIIRPKGDGRRLVYSQAYLEANYSRFEKLNSLDKLNSFIEKYEKIGNIIPIWPGGNVHRGQFQCYDIPNVYFNDPKISSFVESYNSSIDEDKNKIPNLEKYIIDDLIHMDEEKYKNFLDEIVKKIDERTKLLDPSGSW
ncbi:hypothetical protein [Streptococcus suis]|uniref:hypothetical protein n=1 Tax=Streptococcus TaxID=1301 RepID=UPI0030C9D72B